MDNGTISGETINAVERLSLYPEIITAFVYRVTESQVSQVIMGFFCYVKYQDLEFISGGLGMNMSRHIYAPTGESHSSTLESCTITLQSIYRYSPLESFTHSLTLSHSLALTLSLSLSIPLTHSYYSS